MVRVGFDLLDLIRVFRNSLRRESIWSVGRGGMVGKINLFRAFRVRMSNGYLSSENSEIHVWMNVWLIQFVSFLAHADTNSGYCFQNFTNMAISWCCESCILFPIGHHINDWLALLHSTGMMQEVIQIISYNYDLRWLTKLTD